MVGQAHLYRAGPREVDESEGLLQVRDVHRDQVHDVGV
jgi:hypothetical protein